MAVWFTQSRALFSKTCTDKKMYYTLCLVGAAEIALNAGIGALACMSNVKNKIRILFNPSIEPLVVQNPLAFHFLMFHEIRHVIQFSSLENAMELLNLSPLVERGQKMAQECEDVKGKETWLKWVEQLADRKNPATIKLLADACNIGMDAAVNRDCMELFGEDTKDLINEFINKDQKEKKSLVTVESLSKMCNTELLPNAEWVYYADAYLNALSNDINDPNDIPQTVFTTLDDHSKFPTDAEGQAEMQQACANACDRAKDEAEFMSHKAGTSMGDAKFISKLVVLDRRIKNLLERIKFKVKRIHQPSPEEQYTFRSGNRLWPDSGLPGTENVTKPKLAVALVIDTSGSCWRPDWLNQMMAVARHLHKKKQLGGVWSFDVDMVTIPFSGEQAVNIGGGGGTVWRDDYVDTILKELKSKRVDILLLSDMEIIGIEKLEQDKRVTLHKINVESLLKGQ
jgi:hypothetical protein